MLAFQSRVPIFLDIDKTRKNTIGLPDQDDRLSTWIYFYSVLKSQQNNSKGAFYKPKKEKKPIGTKGKSKMYHQKNVGSWEANGLGLTLN